MNERMSDEFIRSQIPKFKWFTHVNFGNGIAARSTSWADAPEDSRHAGIGKFEFIVRRNLPDLQGKRVLDLGCNVGVVAIHMARSGAAEVVGIDSDATWPGFLQQAHFVKEALEWRCRTSYNVRYLDMNLADLPNVELGRFDVVTALNSFYYLDEGNMARVTRHLSGLTSYFTVQCNTRDHGRLGVRPTPSFVRRLLLKNGFEQVSVDHPWDSPRRGIFPWRYHRPVVVGRK